MENTPTKRFKKRFLAYDEFGFNNKKIIDRTLAGKDSFVLMPTGGGGGGNRCVFRIQLVFWMELRLLSPLSFHYERIRCKALQANGIKSDF